VSREGFLLTYEVGASFMTPVDAINL